MKFAGNWAGRVFGTHTGNMFLCLEYKENIYSGVLRFNSDIYGIVTYDVKASQTDLDNLVIEGSPTIKQEGLDYGLLEGRARLSIKGEIHGEWHTSIGSGGTFVVFPQPTLNEEIEAAEPTPRLHTKRINIGPVSISKDDIIEISERLDKEFKSGRLVITIVSETEEILNLEELRSKKFAPEKAALVRLFARRPDGVDSENMVEIEFGQNFNVVLAQGADQSWVIGRAEKLKSEMKKYEKLYSSQLNVRGITVPRLFFVLAIIASPSIPTLQSRLIFFGIVIALLMASDWIHEKFFPFSTIFLGRKRSSKLGAVLMTILSWLITVTAGTISALLAAYLIGYFDLSIQP